MKTRAKPEFTCFGTRARVDGALIGLSVAALLVIVSASAADAEGEVQQPKVDLARVEPGAILITGPAEPAPFSFDAAKGQIDSSTEGAARATRTVLTTPNLLHPQLEAAAGAIGFAAAPFAAAYGAISAAHHKLPPD